MVSVENIRERFFNVFGGRDCRIFNGPGRVNLIGEHTDYNQGFVLPVAIDRGLMIAARKRDDNKVILYSDNFNETSEFTLDDIQRDDAHPWSNYVRGVVQKITQLEVSQIGGLEAVLSGDVPIGSGLSSSAALEVATGFAFQSLYGFPATPEEMAVLAQHAERDFVGTQCGIMDQFISQLGKKNHALLLDTLSLKYELIPFPDDGVKIVVGDTRASRELASSAYNDRVRECKQAVEILSEKIPSITSLRDVSVEEFEKYHDILPEIIHERAEHVIFENERVLQAVVALKDGNLAHFGRLMNESHISLRDKYEVSSKELNAMVEAAWKIPGVLGSRMTGAGFGGCTVSLVPTAIVDEFKEKVAAEYHEKTGLEPQIYVCSIEDGVREILAS